MALTKTSLIQDGAVTQDKISGNVNLGGPKIANVSIANSSYTILDDTAVDTAGGYLVITGTGFESGAQVIINQTPALSTTYVNSTTLRAQVDSANAATYNVYVVNPDGGTATRINGLTYSGTPTWVTASTLANVVNATAFTGTFEATGATSYANTTALPSGFNLVSANGYYYGNIEVGSQTTYNFTISAIDDENQDSYRSFSLTAVTILPPESIEFLMVAGGGGGGGGADSRGGGGGAGGLVESTSALSITSGTQYNIVIGAGGNGAIGIGFPTSGSNTTAFGITARGGGYGGGGAKENPRSPLQFVGAPGGSGGGGTGYVNYRAGGSTIQSLHNSGIPGIAQYGYNGGNGVPAQAAPGGGGAGGAGAAGPSGNNGGIGRNSSISGTSVGYAGGGHGYLGTNAYGAGIGDTTGDSSGQAALANRGGGGGGGGSGAADVNGGNGGSGVVIIRYSSDKGEAIATTGSPTFTETGGYKIYTFTGSGSITW